MHQRYNHVKVLLEYDLLFNAWFINHKIIDESIYFFDLILELIKIIKKIFISNLKFIYHIL